MGIVWDGSNDGFARGTCAAVADGLRFLCNNYSLDDYHKDLLYVAGDGECKKLEETMLSIARLDARIATVMKCLTDKEAPGGKRKKEYAGLFAVQFWQAPNQIIGEVGDLFVQRAGKELVI